jgi:hypothetical protein
MRSEKGWQLRGCFGHSRSRLSRYSLLEGRICQAILGNDSLKFGRIFYQSLRNSLNIMLLGKQSELVLSLANNGCQPSFGPGPFMPARLLPKERGPFRLLRKNGGKFRLRLNKDEIDEHLFAASPWKKSKRGFDQSHSY